MLNPIGKHIWLIDLVASRNGISYEAICKEWTRSSHNPTRERLPLRTFNNWKKCIQEEFGIRLRCNRATNLYYIEQLDDLQHGSTREWLLNAFTVGNLLSERDALEGRILLEDVPSGQTCLKPVVDSMKDNCQIRFNYQKFVTGDQQEVIYEPYCVKLYERRWYVLGHNIEKDALRTYALDRIAEIELLQETFSMPSDFNADDYYYDCFGVIHDDQEPPVKVRLRVQKEQCDYYRSLPLHWSQREVKTTDDFSEFVMFLRPTFDFIQQLLAQREFTEVLEPASLRTKMRDVIETMLKKYE